MENQERTSETTNLSASAVGALLKGRKIEAIKIVRKERGIGLKEAKDAVEAYLRRDPALGARTKRTGGGSGIIWVLLVAGLATLVWYLITNLGG